MSHQQLWKARMAASRSPPATSMVISLPATLPNPAFENQRYVGMEFRISHSPYCASLQKLRKTGTCTNWMAVCARRATVAERKLQTSRRLVWLSIELKADSNNGQVMPYGTLCALRVWCA